MSKRAAPSVDWHLLSLEQLEQHARDLKELGKSPTAAFTRALREARRQRDQEHEDSRAGA